MSMVGLREEMLHADIYTHYIAFPEREVNYYESFSQLAWAWTIKTHRADSVFLTLSALRNS